MGKKKITTFNLDINVYDAFVKYCDQEEKNRSRVVNNLLNEFLGKRRKPK